MLAPGKTLGQDHCMTAHHFTFAGTACQALPSGALWLPEQRLLCVSDLHLGKSDRIARQSGMMLPPYEVAETLARLEADVQATAPACVLCLGDSFDDPSAAANLPEAAQTRITRLQAGRRWIWIEGNHDPGPVGLGGTHLAELRSGPLTFRHIATAPGGEISGHYHPKHRVGGQSRPAFLYDDTRLIMPAYGAYTGGLSSGAAALRGLFARPPMAVLTGHKAIAVPVTP